MKIATIGINYPQTRIVLNGKVPGIHYYSFQNWYNPFLKRIFRTYEVYWPFFKCVDAYHTINTVMITKKPWCCSFETLVPRTNRFRKKRLLEVFEIMAKDNCKQLIAFSKCNYRMQLNFMRDYPEYEKVINLKTCMITVPQPLLVEAPREKINNGVIKFFFVGNDFIRKGCSELVTALYNLRKKRQDFEIILITNTNNTWNYAFKDFQDTPEYIYFIKRIIEESKDYIHIYPHMPFSEVKKLMASCDVGVLPTWADSYGYSVLEMQGCGLPVVTTNVRALPETNQYGWMINIPIATRGDIDIQNFEHKNMIREKMIKDMYDLFDYILDNRQEIIDRGQDSFEFIKTVHSPEEYTKSIGKIYEMFL